MMRSNMLRAALGGAALLLGLAEARADYPITASTAAANAQLTVCGFSVSNVVMPCHVIVDSSKIEMFKAANPGMVGLAFGGSALALGQKAKAGSLPVALPTDPDILNAAATITAADAVSTTATGQSGVSVVSGVPTTGSVYSYAVNGQSEADFTITGTFVGTLQFEGSANGGGTWTPRSGHVMGTKFRTNQVTGAGIVHINAAGLTNIRIRAIALTSGAPSVQLNTTSGTGSIYVMNPIELSDNTTGNSVTIDLPANVSTAKPAMAVTDPGVIAAINSTAVASGQAGAAPPANANIGYVQLVPGATAQPVDTVVRTIATPRSTILPVQESAATVGVGGSGATTGDILTVVGGTLTPANAATGVAAGTAAKCTAVVTSGAVTACTPLAGSLGSYTVLPANPVATTSSGAGSGATLNMSWVGLAIPVAPVNATRRGLHVEPQGGIAFLRGAGVAATADYNALKVPADALYETSPAFVGTGAISMITAGSTPLGVFAAEY